MLYIKRGCESAHFAMDMEIMNSKSVFAASCTIPYYFKLFENLWNPGFICYTGVKVD